MGENPGLTSGQVDRMVSVSEPGAVKLGEQGE